MCAGFSQQQQIIGYLRVVPLDKGKMEAVVFLFDEIFSHFLTRLNALNIFIIVCHNSIAVKSIEDPWHISAQQVDAFSIQISEMLVYKQAYMVGIFYEENRNI